MKRDGFTLFELIITIVILAILIAIAIPMYGRWLKRESVVNDVKKIYSQLNYLRLKSFTTKEEYSLCWDSNPFNSVVIEKNGVIQYTDKFNHYFIASISAGYSCVDFSTDGVADHIGNIRVYGDDYGANVNCVSVSRVRISVGKWNESEGKCEVQ